LWDLHRERALVYFSERSLVLAKTNAGAPTVFINEFDACRFEGSPDHIQSGSAWATRFILQLMNGNGANSSSLSEILLAPAN
jgi:hypothetical protein